MSTQSAARKNAPAPEHRNAINRDSDEIERITSSKRIAWILQQLVKKRELLTITLDGETEQFTSAIVDVDTGNNALMLDELMPRRGNELLIGKRSFRATGRIDGIMVDFDTSVEEVGSQDGLVCITAGFPDLLYYLQRRDYHRVRLPLSYSVRVTLYSTGDHGEEGQLRDISLGGAQIILPPESAITPGTMYECAFELPTGDSIYCSADVCYTGEFGRLNEVRTGIRFQKLTPFQKRIIERSVVSIEQELRKKLAR